MRSRVLFVVGLISGLLVATAVLGLRSAGLLAGVGVLAFTALLIVLFPVSSSLSRRILYNGAIVLGWIPVLWWFDLGEFSDRMSWVLALSAGGLVAWLFGRPDTVGRAKRLLPRLRWSDLIPVGTGAWGLWLFSPLLLSPSDGRTLTLLMKSGWDHVAHFFMTQRLEQGGSLWGTTGSSPDGSLWVGAAYPKHFHILVDMFHDLIGLPVTDGVLTIRDYGRGTSLTLVIAIVVLSSGLAQLPSLVRRPLVAVPLVALPVSAYLVGPGAVGLAVGFPNFVLACTTVGIAACIAVGMVRIAAPVQMFAAVGMLVAAAHSWLLMLPLAGAVVLVVLLPFARARWRGTPVRWGLTLFAVVCGIAGMALAVYIALQSLNEETLTTGETESFPAGMALGVLLSTAAIALVVIAKGRPTRARGTLVRTTALAVMPTVALCMVFLLGYRQLWLTGELSYYVSKFISGALLAGIPIGIVVVSALIGERTIIRRGWRRATAVVASALFTIAALQPFGYVGPTFGGVIQEQASGMKYRSDAVILTGGDSSEATRLLRAAETAAGLPFGTTVYFAPLPGDPTMHLANQWHLSLAGIWSVNADAPSKLLSSAKIADLIAADDVAGAVRIVLQADPRVTVIVAPQLMTELESRMSLSELERVVTWTK
ncbi:hypothetical protein [Luethyella okanaganae]|uniref:Uncharacterized protein n=1 Tax=Luethyella okanaganae TaxID=69372 RepID=A0ABW1VC34_9MICO